MKSITREQSARIRGLLKGGFTRMEIAKECGVSQGTVSRTAQMLALCGEYVLPGRGINHSHATGEERSRQSAGAAKARASRGADMSYGVDLCDVFAASHSPRSIRYFMGRD